MKATRSSKGFTLLELLIVIFIVGLITTFAYPTYVKHTAHTRRLEGQTALLDLAARMERYHLTNHTYVAATVNNPLSAHQWYTLKISDQTENTYTLQAIPNGDQATRDSVCGTLTLNQAGVKGITGNGEIARCW